MMVMFGYGAVADHGGEWTEKAVPPCQLLAPHQGGDVREATPLTPARRQPRFWRV
jgi:hypothetical protein